MPRLTDTDNLTDSLVSNDYFESDVYDYNVNLSVFAFADMELTVQTKVMLHTKPSVIRFVFHIKYHSVSISDELQEVINSINSQRYYIAHEKIKNFLNRWYRGTILLGGGEYIDIMNDVYIHNSMFHQL